MFVFLDRILNSLMETIVLYSMFLANNGWS